MLKVAGFQLGRSAARLSLPVPFSAVWSLGGNGQATSLVRLQHTTRFSTLRQFNSISRGLSAEKTRPPGQTTPSKAPHAADNVQLSTKQVEFETSADSDVNSFTTPRLDPSIPHPTGRQSTQDPGVSELQPEYQRDSGPEANSIAKEPDSTFDETSPISLPDLTQGIPSTIDAELAQRRQDGRPQNRDLSLAEAEGTAGSNQAGEAGRSRPSYISDLERRRQRAANYLLTFLLVSTIGTTVFLGRNWDTPEEEAAHYDAPSGWGLLAFWRRIKARVNGVTSYYTEPTSTKLLPDREADRPDHFLALSLEDLLIHSEWSREHGWRLAKRPGVDYFLQYLSQYYEIAIWTSMPFATAVGMLVKLDPYRLAYPMFREATRYQNGEHIKVS